MINQQLLDYIKQQLGNAISPEKIRADLISKGWESVDIEYALEEAGKQDTVVPNMGGAVQPPAPQQYYEAMVPVEDPKKSRGMVEGIISIACAVVAFIFIPVVFGTLGIVLGVIALKKGQKALGLIGIILSSIFLVMGLIFSILLYLSKH